MNNTVTIPVAETCEYRNCSQQAEFAYVVTGEAGRDGIAVYCGNCSEEWADPSNNHTAIAEVDHD